MITAQDAVDEPDSCHRRQGDLDIAARCAGGLLRAGADAPRPEGSREGGVYSWCGPGEEVGRRVAVRREVPTGNLAQVTAEEPRGNRSQPHRRSDRRGCQRPASFAGDRDWLHHDLQRRGRRSLGKARLDVVRSLSRPCNFAVRASAAVMDYGNRRGLRAGGGGFQVGPPILATSQPFDAFFDTLVEQVRERNPNAITV